MEFNNKTYRFIRIDIFKKHFFKFTFRDSPSLLNMRTKFDLFIYMSTSYSCIEIGTVG